MRCRDLEEIVVQLAKGDADDASALEHAAVCAACAERLASERRVTAAIRAYAANSAGASAPERLEDALLTAFRQMQQVRPARRAAGQWRAWAPALAAGVAVLAIALGIQPVNPVPNFTPPAVTAPPSEVATEYFPLQYGTDVAALEGAPVIRVELPRVVVASFGLPVRTSRGELFVKGTLKILLPSAKCSIRSLAPAVTPMDPASGLAGVKPLITPGCTNCHRR
jgi:hypothetical protein